MQLKRLNPGIARYVVAGALSYAIELTALLTFHKAMGLSVEAATAIAFWIGLTASFFFQKIFAFKDYQRAMKAITHQLVAYGILVLVNYLFTLAVVSAFPAKDIVFSRTFALIIVTVWNYYVYRRFIFRKEPYEISPRRAVGYINQNRRKIIFVCLATVPVLLFFYQYLSTPGRYIVGDFDYYAQLYEAARITVLHYHQFPWWNPWLAGGVPLFQNPQFGLLSPAFAFVLLFGTLYGMKLAYISYAVAGFWGMYILGRRVLNGSPLRSLLISYIWIFCGFFAGHNISHFTFKSYFLVPWLIYFIARRRQRRSWLWLGLTESIIILSDVHYAFLMSALVMAVFFILTLLIEYAHKRANDFRQIITRADIWFIVKALLVVLVLASYRFITTYYFVSHNEKSQALVSEPAIGINVVFDALFSPVNTLTSAPKTLWGWGEYSMYIGMGSAAALLVLLGGAIANAKKIKRSVAAPAFVMAVLIIGLGAFGLAFGDFGSWSPFHILHMLPGFTQTRVSARWLIFVVFALLVFLGSWKRNARLINVLLALSVIELFFTFGPPRFMAGPEVSLPAAHFSSTFTQYDNGMQHLDSAQSPMHSYYYTTTQNIGQVYADDSLVDTLHQTRATSRCGLNINPACSFVMTGNAVLTYWSPNKILIKRTGPGDIELNMNVDAGWRVNGVYPYALQKTLEPSNLFVLPAGQAGYTLQYVPKLSPAWVAWKLNRL